MNIIIFAQMGAGKDTVAKLISALMPTKNYVKVGLGTPIRQTVNMASPDDPDKRAKQQSYGQAMRQIFGEDYWNNTLKQSIDIISEEHPEVNYIISDGRQPSELEFWQEEGFLTIGITADEDVRAQRLLTRDGVDQRHRFNHETEIDAAECVERCHFIIDNSGDVETLVDSVIAVLSAIYGEVQNDSQAES